MLLRRSIARVSNAVTHIRTFSGAAAAAEDVDALEREYLVSTYSGDGVRGKPGLHFTSGKGSRLYDQHNNEYIDWVAGIAVNSLGHSDPTWIKAVTEQAPKLAHVSNLFHSKEPLLLARDLVKSTKHFQKVFLCNSGTEANEAALKFARKYALVHDKVPKPAGFGCKSATPTACETKGGVCDCWPQAQSPETLRREFIAFKHSFHGRSMGALAVTHKPQIRQPFAPFAGDVHFAAFNSLKDVEKYASKRTAAIIVEPMQGEGGIYPADHGFMKGLRQVADSVGALLIVDEVQCGLGRTGRLWAHEAYDVRPDIMTLAKPLAGGLPIGAVLVSDAVAKCIVPGDHGTTYGGNPFVAHVARTVFNQIANPAFLEASRQRGRQMLSGWRAMQAKYPDIIAQVRGPVDEGLFVGVEVRVPPKQITGPCLEKGLIIITAGDNVLRICPPLNIAAKDIEDGFKIVDQVLASVKL